MRKQKKEKRQTQTYKDMKISTIFILAIVFSFILFSYMHEQVHKEIYKSFGMDSVIYIDFPDLVTEAVDNFKNCNEYCNLAHNINEAVSYPLMGFFVLFSLGLLIIIQFLENDSL